ncbi:MAG: limonene hydroxylase [Bacillaceae bacterium]|nr:limonene hydroxylase [Bacillaceae bacterium]
MYNFRDNHNLYPWMNRKTIYEVIKEQVDQHGRVVDDKLPDDEDFWSDEPVRWVAGGLDNIFGHHVSNNKQADVSKLVSLFLKQCKKPTNRNRKKLYLSLLEEHAVSIIDDFLDALRAKETFINVENLYNEAYWLAERGTHRNPVKFGIAILGLFQTDHHLELITTLGVHDEFTLFSAVAIQNSTDKSNDYLFQLAKSVDGWGKINLVERIKPETKEIKDWLIREGYKNNIMYEYLAYTCAVNGELHNALSAERIDRPLFDGAGDIISALIAGGPAENIDDYEKAPIVIKEFLRHSATMCTTVKHLNDMINIYQFLKDDEDWENRLAEGWTPEQRDQFLLSSEELIFNEKWEHQIWEGLKSKDSFTHWNSMRAARFLDIDIWDELFNQLGDHPVNSILYQELMRTDKKDRIQRLVDFAEQHLPLMEIATGPAEEMGLGKDFEAHSCLDIILQDLDKYNGVGKELVAAGLQSPVIRNRNMAIKVLKAWTAAEWGEKLIEAIKMLAEIEPVTDVKEELLKIIQEKEI